MDLIRKIVPGARFILMVRDGRDIAASFVTRYNSADKGRRRWLEDNEVVRAEAQAADVFLLRYEDLVETTEAKLREVCAFLGLPYAPDMLNYHAKERLWFGVDTVKRGDGTKGAGHRNLRNWQVNQPMFDDRGKWRKVLTEEDVAKFRHPRAARMLRFFGYDIDDASG